MTNIRCPLCGGDNAGVVLTNDRMYFTNKDCNFDLVVQMCGDCDFVFQSSAYSPAYDKIIPEIYKDFRKNEYFTFPNRTDENIGALSLLTANLPQRENLNILEIGSNRGDLLYMIKEAAPKVNVLGIEPTDFADLPVPTIKGYFNKGLFLNKFDVIILQHVLEHIKYPKAMLSDIGQLLSEDGIVYIEVPYLNNALKYRVEDFMLEHVNYFGLKTLNDALGSLNIVYHDNAAFLRVIAKKSGSRIPLPQDTQGLKDEFAAFNSNKKKIISGIKDLAESGKKIIFYGVSYYYRIIFKEIEPFIKIENCYYYDDNYNKGVEEIFNLPRLQKFDGDCVAVICSTNFKIQEKIEKKLIPYKGLTAVRPWYKISIS